MCGRACCGLRSTIALARLVHVASGGDSADNTDQHRPDGRRHVSSSSACPRRLRRGGPQSEEKFCDVRARNPPGRMSFLAFNAVSFGSIMKTIVTKSLYIRVKASSPTREGSRESKSSTGSGRRGPFHQLMARPDTAIGHCTDECLLMRRTNRTDPCNTEYRRLCIHGARLPSRVKTKTCGSTAILGPSKVRAA